MLREFADGAGAVLPQTWLLVLAPPLVLVDYTTVQMGIKPGTWGLWIF